MEWWASAVPAEEARQTLRLSLQRGAEDPVALRELLALAEAQLGNVRAAATLLAEVLRSERARHGDRSPELGVTLQRLALLCHQLEEEKTAAHYENWARTLA